MRFFTPDLYLQFNSPDDRVADRANEVWEKAIRRYQRHLAGFGDRLPSQVRRLAELCLHDWEWLAFHQEAEPASPSTVWSAVAVLSLRQKDQATVLVYLLWDRAREHPPKQDWPFSKKRKHWLYDEVDEAADQRGRFLHRILVSDGGVVEIPFAAIFIQSFSLDTPEKARSSRKTA